MTQTTATQESKTLRGDKDSIRPFRANIAEAALVDLRRRLASTRLP
jgi:hypothetical protein